MQTRIKAWPKVPNDVVSRRGHRPHAYVLACLEINRAIAEAYHASGILAPAQVERSKAKANLVVTVVVRDR
jgi:hypothetical protein